MSPASYRAAPPRVGRTRLHDAQTHTAPVVAVAVDEALLHEANRAFTVYVYCVSSDTAVSTYVTVVRGLTETRNVDEPAPTARYTSYPVAKADVVAVQLSVTL